MSYKFSGSFSVGRKKYEVEGVGSARSVKLFLRRAGRKGRIGFLLHETTAELKLARSAGDEAVLNTLRKYCIDWGGEMLECAVGRIKWGDATLNWHSKR